MLYDFNERRQIESRGTEAVLNALWETQRADGRWGWLEFGLLPRDDYAATDLSTTVSPANTAAAITASTVLAHC